MAESEHVSMLGVAQLPKHKGDGCMGQVSTWVAPEERVRDAVLLLLAIAVAALHRPVTLGSGAGSRGTCTRASDAHAPNLRPELACLCYLSALITLVVLRRSSCLHGLIAVLCGYRSPYWMAASRIQRLAAWRHDWMWDRDDRRRVP